MCTACLGPALVSTEVKPYKESDVKLPVGDYTIYVSRIQAPYIERITMDMLYNEEEKLQRQILDEVQAEAQKAGDKEVYRFDMNHIDGEAFYGNDWHPNIYQDEKMAGELTAYLRVLMNWF